MGWSFYTKCKEHITKRRNAEKQTLKTTKKHYKSQSVRCR